MSEPITTTVKGSEATIQAGGMGRVRDREIDTSPLLDAEIVANLPHRSAVVHAHHRPLRRRQLRGDAVACLHHPRRRRANANRFLRKALSPPVVT